MQPYTPRKKPEFPVPISSQAVREIFSRADDLTERTLQVGQETLTVFFIDGLTASGMISEYVIWPVMQNLGGKSQEEMFSLALRGQAYNAAAKEAEDMDALCSLLLNGFCIVVFDTINKALAFETKTPEKRSPAPPQTEGTVKGAKDAFTETNRTNTSLIRRHLRSTRLQVEETVVGRKTRTNVSVLSLRGLTDPKLLEMVKSRLDNIDVDGFLSPSMVEEYLTGARKTAFPLTQYTERTDKFCQGLLAGQVGVIVDGLPLGFLLPVDLGLIMTSQEDVGENYLVASFVRCIRYIAMLVALLLPALYVAMAQFHPAMIPTRLLLAMIESKKNVPFPTVFEVLGLLIAFELLQEAGLHLPRSIGHTVSIIGGLVVGTAAVEASLISPGALVAVSVAGICGFAVPNKDFGDGLRLWRIILSLCAAILGLYGLTLGAICLLVHLGSLTSCSRPYLAPFSSASSEGAILRRRLITKKFRDPKLRPQDKRNKR